MEALDLPNASRLALLLVQDRTSSTPWRLTLDTTPRALGREAEPNDDPRQAQPLSGDALRGSLAGPGDRDVILVEAGRSVRIENVGDVALALRAWEGEQPLVVAPGAHGLLPRERLTAREDQARVVVEAAPGESGAGARYVLSQ